MYKDRNEYFLIIRYLIVGGATTFVSLAIFYGVTYTFLNGENSIQLQIANILSWIGSVIFAYYTNRKFVFNSQNSNIIKEFLMFSSGRIITLILDMVLMFILSSCFIIDYRVSKLIVSVIVVIGNYIISKAIVFNK